MTSTKWCRKSYQIPSDKQTIQYTTNGFDYLNTLVCSCLVLLCVIFTFAGITALTQKSMALDTELNQLKDMFSIDESKYICQICNKNKKNNWRH
jgi:hypothetical protein